MTTEDKTKPATDLFDQAMKNYEQALKTGMKLQEEAAKLFTHLANQGGSPQDWQKRVKSMTEDVVPQTQKALDEGLKVIEQTSRTSVELLRKAVAAGQQPTSLQDAQGKFLGLWEASLNAVRDTTVSMAQANTKAIESWIAYARKSGEAAPGGAKT
jgi:hypothetical protein